jgi:membrane fusion protein (multidrug efflux system)
MNKALDDQTTRADPPRSRLLAFGGFAALALAGGAAGWLLLAEPASDARETQGPRSRTVPVETARAESGRAATLITATGTLRASDAVVVQPEVGGRVTEVRFEQGQAVRAGTPLIELDKVTLRAEREKAEAALVLARENFRRAEQLSRQGATAARALDEARAALRGAEAEAELARARLERATVVAPFDGVVGLKEISVGRYVTPGDELVRLQRIDPLDLDFRVPERWLTKLQRGQEVTVAVDAVPGRAFSGTIVALDPLLDVNGRAVRVRASVANPERVLRPGLFARVSLEIDARPDAVLVPEAAVALQERGSIVYRIEDGLAVATPVVTGVRRDGKVEIVEGLTADDEVVVSGQVRLRDRAQVEIIAPAQEDRAG